MNARWAHVMDDLIRRTVDASSRCSLRHVTGCVLRWGRGCVEAEGGHSEHLL
jgi:hypothetical protein